MSWLIWLALHVSYSLYLHAEQLQQRREDAHVIEQKHIVSGPVEHVHLCVTLIKHSWEETCGQRQDILYISYYRWNVFAGGEALQPTHPVPGRGWPWPPSVSCPGRSPPGRPAAASHTPSAPPLSALSTSCLELRDTINTIWLKQFTVWLPPLFVSGVWHADREENVAGNQKIWDKL